MMCVTEEMFGDAGEKTRQPAFMNYPLSRGFLELFYRFYLTPFVHVTPDVQLIIDPSDAPDEDAIWVFGLRLRVLF